MCTEGCCCCRQRRRNHWFTLLAEGSTSLKQPPRVSFYGFVTLNLSFLNDININATSSPAVFYNCPSTHIIRSVFLLYESLLWRWGPMHIYIQFPTVDWNSRFIIKIQEAGFSGMFWSIGIWYLFTEAAYRSSDYVLHPWPETLLFISPTVSHCCRQVAAPFFDVCRLWVIDACRDLLSSLSQSQMNEWIDHSYHSERARLEESLLSGKQTRRC